MKIDLNRKPKPYIKDIIDNIWSQIDKNSQLNLRYIVNEEDMLEAFIQKMYEEYRLYPVNGKDLKLSDSYINDKRNSNRSKIDKIERYSKSGSSVDLSKLMKYINFSDRIRKCFSNDYVESKLSESSYIIPNPPKEFKVPYAVIIYDLDGKFKNGFLEINDEEENNSDFINNEFKDSINRYLKSGKSDLLVRYYQNQNNHQMIILN